MRPLAALFGMVLLLLGVMAAAVGAETLPGLTDPTTIRFFAAIAFLGVVNAGWIVIKEWNPEPEHPPDIEMGVRVPVPGDSMDDLLFARHGDGGQRGNRQYRRNRVQEILENVVINTLVIDCNLALAEARAQVEHGNWTDDELVAEYISGATEERSDSGRLPSLRRRYPPVDEMTRRTIREIERLRGDRP